MIYFNDLKEACEFRDREWDPERKLTALFRATELGGEVGEALNVIKKLEREKAGIQGSRDTIEHLAEELADVAICLQNLANGYGIDLKAAVVKKFNATSEKMNLETRLMGNI